MRPVRKDSVLEANDGGKLLMIVAQESITIVNDYLNGLCTEQENLVKLKELCARRSVYKESCKTWVEQC